MKAFFASRLWRMLLLPLIVFGVTAWLTNDQAFILVLSIVQAGVAAAVVTAYTPEVMLILLNRRPMTQGSWLGYGIWLSWGAVVWRTVESLVWRYLGQPPWLINSDVTSTYLFIGCLAAVAHIARPGELDNRIPRSDTIFIGAIIGTLMVIGLTLVYLPEIAALVHGTPIHGDALRRAVG